MPRKPSVRYFTSRGAYYCQWQNQQHRLATGPDDAPTGPVYLEALAKFKGLLEMGQIDQAGDSNTVRVILEAYLQYIEHKRKAATLSFRLHAYKPFVALHGDLRVADLKHYH